MEATTRVLASDIGPCPDLTKSIIDILLLFKMTQMHLLTPKSSTAESSLSSEYLLSPLCTYPLYTIENQKVTESLSGLDNSYCHSHVLYTVVE